jgi:hypothetical protein
MQSFHPRKPVDTGPVEVRDFGPHGRRLGTCADCYPGSKYELHRGELIEQMGSKDLHGIAMAIAAALFRAHARPGHQVMTDVYCDLSDEMGPSLRAPDVTLVANLKPKNEVYTGRPVLAVEVRGTQSKKYLEEKILLFLEHDWPLVWIIHVEQCQFEVRRPGQAAVFYGANMNVPLPPALDAHGLESVPVECFFDSEVAVRYVADVLVDEGKKLALIENVADICELLELPFDASRRRQLAHLDVAALEALRLRIKRDRAW